MCIRDRRNAYLKSTDNVDINFLSVLDEQLSDFGARVIEHRLESVSYTHLSPKSTPRAF